MSGGVRYSYGRSYKVHCTVDGNKSFCGKHKNDYMHIELRDFDKFYDQIETDQGLCAACVRHIRDGIHQRYAIYVDLNEDNRVVRRKRIKTINR